MLTLFKKELNSLLNSLIGYVVIIVFLIVTGLFLWIFPNDFNIIDFGYASLESLFLFVPVIFMFIIPAITMRSFSDEKKTGTFELLATQPLTDLQIIFAKYLASVSMVVILLIPTLVYFATLYWIALPAGNIDAGGTWGSYLGLFFLGASFASIGVFASSLSDNQIVAFIIAVFLSGFFYLGFEFIYSFDLFGKFDLVIKSLGMNVHYASISRGVIDSRDVVYFLSIIALFILGTKTVLISRKW